MPNARTSDAAMGWMIFRSRNPEPSLDELNEELSSLGRGTVSDRTVRHYRTLRRYGCDKYLPINDLDMRIKHGLKPVA